ncbi:hypothetical protein [Neisseria sp. Ec49-e6-T10]|uniref:hypothetical protein n=1 Tax=Neisseria sp. Ec49-e6-T10 TaxID=3140744 RepID=UPI003EB84EB1
MPPFSEKLNTILETFANTELKDNGGKNSPEYKNLIAAINATPSLQNALEEAVKNEGIESFVVGVSDPTAIAEYSSEKRTVYLKSEALTGSLGTLVSSIAHETNHALNKDIYAKDLKVFFDQAGDIAQSDKPIHDYTNAIKSMLEAKNKSEAKAEIAAWNAELEYLKSKQPDLTLKDLFDQSSYMYKFIDVRYDEKLNEVVYESKKGININADLSIDASDENISGSREYYFDVFYKNQEGAKRVGDVFDFDAIYDRGAKIVIDMGELKLDPAELEKNGFKLDGKATSATYYDPNDLNKKLYLNQNNNDKNTNKTIDEDIDNNKDDITKIIKEYQNSTKEESRQREEKSNHEYSEIKALHDKIGGYLYPSLEKLNVHQNHADSMVTTAVKQAVDKKITADDVIHVGVDQAKNLIGVFTKDSSKMASFDAIEASKNDPEQTLNSAQQQLEQQPEQELQRQLALQTKDRSGPSMEM